MLTSTEGVAGFTLSGGWRRTRLRSGAPLRATLGRRSARGRRTALGRRCGRWGASWARRSWTRAGWSRDHRAFGSTHGSPSDPRDPGTRESAIGEDAIGEGGHSTTRPIDAPSFLPTSANEVLAVGDTRARPSSPSSSRSDFGPFSVLLSFDNADPRELAKEGWDSDADWGFGGAEPCGLDVDDRDKSKPRRQKDSTAAAAPLRSSKRR